MRARRIRSSSTTCLSGIHNGAKLYVVDPRRTASAQWADGWLGLDVGSDIALANAVGREILAAGLENRAFIERATSGFEAYRAAVEPVHARERRARRPAFRRNSSANSRTPTRTRRRAQLCWTLGITEHHNAVDNVRALINLALLTGHVGRYGSGLNPLRGQNNVQGGGDMGAIPNKFPGGQDVEDPSSIAKFEGAWGVDASARARLESDATCSTRWNAANSTRVYVIGENPAQSEADQHHAVKLLRGLEHFCRARYLLDEDRRAGRRRAAGDARAGARPREP